MLKSNKLRSFSLNELMVVLVITVLIVGMAFSVLRLVQGQMRQIGGILDQRMEIDQLRQALWVDINQYPMATYDPKKGRVLFSNALGHKEYQILEDRLATPRDTFHVKIGELRFLYQNRDVTYGEFDALKLTTSKETGHQPLFVFRNRTASNQMY
ncbi:MAG: hypothetical protein AB3N16_10940 [Flavobacteriaceae bacterium]